MPRFVMVLCILSLAVPASAQVGVAYSWSKDGPCATGGGWYAFNCWTPEGVPDSQNDSANLGLDQQGTITIPTTFNFGVALNSITVGPNVALVLNSNTNLNMVRSSAGIDPSFLLFGSLSLNSGGGGTSSLVLGTASTGNPPVLQLNGSGEIELGLNGGINSGIGGTIVLGGGLEIYTVGSDTKPAKIFGLLHNEGGEISVLTGTLQIAGEVVNLDGGFVQVNPQFPVPVTLEVYGVVRGEDLYPGSGLGKVDMTGGQLAGIHVAPGLVEVSRTSGFAGRVELDSGTTVEVLAGATLDFESSGAEGPPDIINNGVIRLGDPATSGAVARADESLARLFGTGTLIMDNFGSALQRVGVGTFWNGPEHTIAGQGSILAPIQNEGLIVATGGTLTFYSNLSQFNDGGDVTALGNGPAEPGTISVNAPFRTRHLRIAPYGRLHVHSSQNAFVDGDFDIESIDETALDYASGSALWMTGQGPHQALEVASEDLGAVAGGFTSNFGHLRLVVDQAGTYVFLRDLYDNGNRGGGHEAAYVNVLEVNPGSTLDLNTYCLYTMYQGSPHRVAAGDGPLFGGGDIVDVGGGTTDVPTRAPIALHAPVPNPFNPATEVAFTLGADALISLEVYDVAGRRMKSLAAGAWPAGDYSVHWDGRTERGAIVASGVYFFSLTVDGTRLVSSGTLIK